MRVLGNTVSRISDFVKTLRNLCSRRRLQAASGAGQAWKRRERRGRERAAKVEDDPQWRRDAEDRDRPETYDVTADGELLVCATAETLRHFCFDGRRPPPSS
jgi:hypothetical protein